MYVYVVNASMESFKRTIQCALMVTLVNLEVALLRTTSSNPHNNSPLLFCVIMYNPYTTPNNPFLIWEVIANGIRIVKGPSRQLKFHAPLPPLMAPPQRFTENLCVLFYI